jgi:hypothetical protein
LLTLTTGFHLEAKVVVSVAFSTLPRSEPATPYT